MTHQRPEARQGVSDSEVNPPKRHNEGSMSVVPPEPELPYTSEPVAPMEFALSFTPRDRFDIIDMHARASEVHGEAFNRYAHHLYASKHTTAGFLPQRLAARLMERFGGVAP